VLATQAPALFTAFPQAQIQHLAASALLYIAHPVIVGVQSVQSDLRVFPAAQSIHFPLPSITQSAIAA